MLPPLGGPSVVGVARADGSGVHVAQVFTDELIDRPVHQLWSIIAGLGGFVIPAEVVERVAHRPHSPGVRWAGSCAATDARSTAACGPSIHGTVSTSVAGAPEANT